MLKIMQSGLDYNGGCHEEDILKWKTMNEQLYRKQVQDHVD